MKRTLHLTIKKKWFDMIKSGVKIEEYREIKPYWTKRLFRTLPENGLCNREFRAFDVIEFRNGYRKDSPKIKADFFRTYIGRGLPEWGAPMHRDVYILQFMLFKEGGDE